MDIDNQQGRALHEVLGINPDNPLLKPEHLLALLLHSNAGADFLRELGIATNRDWSREQVLQLVEPIPQHEAHVKNENNLQKETGMFKSATKVWVFAHQTLNLIAQDNGDGLACQAVEAQYLGCLGENLSFNSPGLVLAQIPKDFSTNFLNLNGQGQIPSFNAIRGELKQNGTAIRHTDHELFIMGIFSSEQESIYQGGRFQRYNFIRIQFKDSNELAELLRQIESKRIDPKSIYLNAVISGLNRAESLPIKGKTVSMKNPELHKFIERAQLTGWASKFEKPSKFTDEQINDMNTAGMMIGIRR